MIQSPPPLPERQETWLQRNRRWFVPCACVAGFVGFLGFVALIVATVFGFMKRSDAYSGALARVKADSAVIEQLGTPISEGWFVTGNINISGSSGQAQLVIPVSGPKAKATVEVVALKQQGRWYFIRLIVQIDGASKRIDLSEKEPSQQSGPTTGAASPSTSTPPLGVAHP